MGVGPARLPVQEAPSQVSKVWASALDRQELRKTARCRERHQNSRAGVTTEAQASGHSELQAPPALLTSHACAPLHKPHPSGLVSFTCTEKARLIEPQEGRMS